MSYKITLEIYVNEQATFPTIKVESQKNALAFLTGNEANGADTPADTEALEGVLTRTRQFAETLTRGVEVAGVGEGHATQR